MTLFRQYFRAQLSGLLIWLGAGGAMVFVLARSAPIDASGAQALEALVGKMPESMKMMFGIEFGLSPADSFVSMKLAPGIALILCMYIVITALSIVTREVDRRTIDFLLGMPVDRRQVLVSRAGVMIVNTAILAVAYWAIMRVVFGALEADASYSRYAELIFTQWLLAVALGSITLLSSIWIDDYSFGVKLWLGVVATSYFLELVLRAAGLTRWQRFFIPFSYADPASIIKNGMVAADILVLVAVAAVALIASVPLFERKEIAA
ncbi:MAG TPA: ABC transporter permease subunit [Symbiobacteriaceae bacterium]|nr:ABC transporter permease subunit [Symbiobacteriaceae bacterium]